MPVHGNYLCEVPEIRLSRLLAADDGDDEEDEEEDKEGRHDDEEEEDEQEEETVWTSPQRQMPVSGMNARRREVRP